MLPQPTVTSGYDPDDGMVTTAQLRQSLWTGGRLTANVNQAIFDDKAAVEYVYEQQNQVAKTTIEAWQSYITAVTMQQVYYESLALLDDFEKMMQRRVNQGVSARIELDLVSNRILQEQNSYQAAVEQQRIAIARLEQITGRRLTPADLPVPNLEALVARAKQYTQAFEQMAFDQASFYNPTVVKEHYQIEAAKQEVKALQAGYYPTIYAQYEHSYYHEDDDDEGEFSVGLSYDPGAGFSNFSLARASEARVNSLVQSQEASRRTVLETIQTQYQQFASAKDQERSLIAAVAGAQIVVNSYRRQFIAGRKSWLEVLNAVREHSQYQIQLVETRTNIIAAYYKLQVDFGMMGWQDFDHSRQSEPLFSPLDPVKKWFYRQENDQSDEGVILPTGMTSSSIVLEDYMTDEDKNSITKPYDTSVLTSSTIQLDLGLGPDLGPEWEDGYADDGLVDESQVETSLAEDSLVDDNFLMDEDSDNMLVADGSVTKDAVAEEAMSMDDSYLSRSVTDGNVDNINNVDVLHDDINETMTVAGMDLSMDVVTEGYPTTDPK